jgi:hypothetical protein
MNSPSLIALPISGDLPDVVIRRVINSLPSYKRVQTLNIYRDPAHTDANVGGVVPSHEGNARIMWWIDYFDPDTSETAGNLTTEDIDTRLEILSRTALRETLEYYSMAPPENIEWEDVSRPGVNTKELTAAIYGQNWDEGKLLFTFTELLMEKINIMKARINKRYAFYQKTLPAGIPILVRDETDPENPTIIQRVATEAYAVWYVPTLHPSRQSVRATTTRGAGLLHAARNEAD